LLARQMCDHFTHLLTWAEIVRLYRLTLDQPARNIQQRFNVCPTTPVEVVVSVDGKRSLVPVRWGLIPGWWSKPLKEMKLATFNARAETIATKPMFRDSFKRRRCLMPASGYYEWRTTPEGKQPFYFTRRDGQPISGENWTHQRPPPSHGGPACNAPSGLQRLGD
jgi:putative SOS response-associated peptidase YedK